MLRMITITACTAAIFNLSACSEQTEQQAQEAADQTVAAAKQAAQVAERETEQALAKINEAASGADADALTDWLDEDKPKAAIAVLHATAGSQAKGKVHFVPTKNGVKVATTMTGLNPGKHGHHLHLYGDCSAPDASSAGPHFNLQGSSKNPPEDIDRVTGNLGNLNADNNGNAQHEAVIKNASLTGPKSIIGRSVVVHEKGNDHSHAPDGAAGNRQVCGVIGIAEPRQRP